MDFRRLLSLCAAVALLVALLSPRIAPGRGKGGFREEFSDLARWEEFSFPSIPRHSRYSVSEIDGVRALKMESRASASGLILKRTFSLRETPFLSFRARVENVYRKGDARRKEGDDYPLRIYVIFLERRENLSFFEKLFLTDNPFNLGDFVPISTLTYVWANRDWGEKIVTNPFSQRAKMYMIEKGEKNAGKWMIFRRNIRDDASRAFGSPPSDTFAIAVMNDSDNTGESSISFLDFIEVSGE